MGQRKFQVGESAVLTKTNKWVIPDRYENTEVKIVDFFTAGYRIETVDGSQWNTGVDCLSKDPRDFNATNAKKMLKFKVGDVVMANKKADAHYGVTREGWKGIVTKVSHDSFKAKNSEKDKEFDFLYYQCFDLVTPKKTAMQEYFESEHPKLL